MHPYDVHSIIDNIKERSILHQKKKISLSHNIAQSLQALDTFAQHVITQQDTCHHTTFHVLNHTDAFTLNHIPTPLLKKWFGSEIIAHIHAFQMHKQPSKALCSAVVDVYHMHAYCTFLSHQLHMIQKAKQSIHQADAHWIHYIQQHIQDTHMQECIHLSRLSHQHQFVQQFLQ
ncbi:MAG: hypothetical protein ACMXYC_03670 [Candidatus Woesearchaeota archaeon]